MKGEGMKDYDDVQCIACGDNRCEKCMSIEDLQAKFSAVEADEDIMFPRMFSLSDCQMILGIAETLDKTRPAVAIYDVDKKIAFLKTLAMTVLNVNPSVFEIGQYSITKPSPFQEDMLWIENEEGEGVETTVNAFEKAVDTFFRTNF